ncbi:ATPase AAA [Bacteroidia bacterium]|nr:ATPase AAA [Bacteroidia bacterium]
MVYLENFYLPFGNRRTYPYNILCPKMLDAIAFSPVTIFYGNNGSGKSTLLNVIAEKTKIQHKTKGNSSLYFNDFVEKCAFELATRNGKSLKIPTSSRFVRSEDMMEGIVKLRNETEKAENKIFAAQDGTERQFAWNDYNEISEQYSNGETAIAFFENIFEPDTLYLLDEPENSLAPNLQLKLSDIIAKCAYLLNCQFIIATHSPFLLALHDAKIYNLDKSPASIENWYELDNLRIYYDFFKLNEKKFNH